MATSLSAYLMVPLGKEEMTETLQLSPPRASKTRDSRNIAALLVPVVKPSC